MRLQELIDKAGQTISNGSVLKIKIYKKSFLVLLDIFTSLERTFGVNGSVDTWC